MSIAAVTGVHGCLQAASQRDGADTPCSRGTALRNRERRPEMGPVANPKPARRIVCMTAERSARSTFPRIRERRRTFWKRQQDESDLGCDRQLGEPANVEGVDGKNRTTVSPSFLPRPRTEMLWQGIFVVTIAEEMRIEAQERYCLARVNLFRDQAKPGTGRSSLTETQVTYQTSPGEGFQWSKASTIRIFGSHHLTCY